MGSTVVWRDGMDHPVVKTGVRNLPKKPVPWTGCAVIYLADGSRLESSWRSRGPLTCEQAREAMHAVVSDMIADLKDEISVDAGFVMQCR